MVQAGYTMLMTLERTEIQTLPAPHWRLSAELGMTLTRRPKYNKGEWERQRQTPSSDTLRHMLWLLVLCRARSCTQWSLRVPFSSAYSMLLWSLLSLFPDYQLSLSCMAATVGMDSNSSSQQCDAWNSIQRLPQPFHPSLWASAVCCCCWESWQLHCFVKHHLGIPRGQNREDHTRTLLYLSCHGVLSSTRSDKNRKTAQEIIKRSFITSK